MSIRDNGQKNITYLSTGKVGCLGIGNKKAMASIDEIARSEGATFKEALSRWNVDESEARLIEPVIVRGPCGLLSRVGKDRRRRWNEYMTYILGFTDKQVLVLTKKWNVHDTDVVTVTEELFYKDVTSITIIETEMGNSLTLKVMGEQFTSGYMSKDILTQDMIQGARNLLREKKSG